MESVSRILGTTARHLLPDRQKNSLADRFPWSLSPRLYLPEMKTGVCKHTRKLRPDVPVSGSKILLFLFLLLTGFTSQAWIPATAQAEDLSEYRLKTAFLYNFAIYTSWPGNITANEFTICIYGEDMFGKHLDHLLQKKVNGRSIRIQRTDDTKDLKDCQIVYISRSSVPDLKTILGSLSGKPVLTVADSPGSGLQGIALNMALEDGKVTFEANLTAARNASLNFSSQLLRFASAIHP